MFIAILNPLMSFLLAQRKKGNDTIEINTIINYIQTLDNQERNRILKINGGKENETNN